MNKTFKKIILLMFLAFVANAASFAVNSEFKNTLTNVDLVKTSEDSYTVNLYTSKKISSPVKVIKKSDLSYYILLPETKNISPNVSAASSDIRNVNLALYPYAGVDVSNGYTKIDITTTKPINFNVATKNSKQIVAGSTSVAVNTNKEQKIQKKNSDIQKTELVKQATKVETQPKVQKTQISKDNEIKKQTPSETVNKKIVSNENKLVAKKEAGKPEIKKNQLVKTEKLEAKKPETKRTEIKKTENKIAKKQTNETKIKTNDIEKKLNKITALQKTSKPKIENVEKPAEVMAAAKIKPSETQVKNTIVDENKIETNTTVEDTPEPIAEETVEEVKEEVTTSNPINDDIEPDSKVVSKKIDLMPLFAKIKNKTFLMLQNAKLGIENGYSNLSGKLYEYNLTIFDLLLMILAGIFSFIVVILVKTKTQSQPKIKSKAELLEKTEPLVAKKEEKETPKDEGGQYFVFENNIKQTGLTTPTTFEEKKNFELVSYDPDLRFDSEAENKNKEEDEDLDIIQKILKDDGFVDIKPIDKEETPTDNVEQAQDTSNVIVEQQAPEAQEVVIKDSEPVKQNINVTSPIGQEHVQKEEVKELTEEVSSEPKLLASYNIAPEYGFMFISYNNNVSLMGFIYDDVYVLHNFKTKELANYNLQFRLVDKDDKSGIYIVKTDAVKLLVKVAKTSMNTELIM